jgi:hypothetical protein
MASIVTKAEKKGGGHLLRDVDCAQRPHGIEIDCELVKQRCCVCDCSAEVCECACELSRVTVFG